MAQIMAYKDLKKFKDQMLKERLDILLPTIMDEMKISAWLVMGDECNEGPVLKRLLPSALYHARRRMAVLFIKTDETYKKLLLSRPDFGIEQYFDVVDNNTNELEGIVTLIKEKLEFYHIDKLHIEQSQDAFCDGLSSYHYNALKRLSELELVPSDLSRVYLESRLPREIEFMTTLTSKTYDIIEEVLSNIQLEESAGEIRHALMEKAISDGLTPWFDATLWIRRLNQPHIDDDDALINEGDLIHIDFGLEYGGYHSDVQVMACVNCQAGVLKRIMTLHEECTELQNIVMAEMKCGLSGNQVLQAVHQKAKHLSIPRVYTHPIGYYGHGPGPTIGLFSNQKEVPVRGDYLLRSNTCYALELSIEARIDEYAISALYGLETEIHLNESVEVLEKRKQLYIIEL